MTQRKAHSDRISDNLTANIPQGPQDRTVFQIPEVE